MNSYDEELLREVLTVFDVVRSRWSHGDAVRAIVGAYATMRAAQITAGDTTPYGQPVRTEEMPG